MDLLGFFLWPLRVFAFNTEKASVTGYDGGLKLKAVASGAGFGDTPTLLEVQ